MAEVNYDALLAAQILEALRSLGFYGASDLSGLSKKDVNDLLKDYYKNTAIPFEEQDDIISGKYTNDAFMSEALNRIAQGDLPETVENWLFDNNYPTTAEQLEDLKDYSSFVEKRNESQRERMFNLTGLAGEYGLSDPMARFEVDPTIAANYFRVDEQGRSRSAPVLDEAGAAQAAYQDYLTMKKTGQDTSNFNMIEAIKERLIASAFTPPGTSRGGVTYNGVYYPTMEAYQNKILADNAVDMPYDGKKVEPTNMPYAGEKPDILLMDSEQQKQRDEYASGTFGPSISSFYASEAPTLGSNKPVPPPPPQGARTPAPSKGFDYRANMVNNASIRAQNEMLKDQMVATALRNRLQTNMGSPFEMDIVSAQRALEQRAAYEAYLAEERRRKKALGY
jgi:hypothetical protein